MPGLPEPVEQEKTTARCTECRSPRVLVHPELEDLNIAHIDCDAFYASIEKRDNPSLIDRPVIIGGGRRGVVSTACYLARIKGVHSAMPMFKALELCPDATVIKPRMALYAETGHRIREAMQTLTPLVEPLSLDEAFLDLSGTAALHGAPPAHTLARLAKRIETDIGITVSIGLSDCKFLAKLASERNKPRGFSIIGRAEAPKYLSMLPISAIWGVGKSLAGKLQADGLQTIGDLRSQDLDMLIKRYGSIGRRLHELSNARDKRLVTPERETKSISSETTFSTDIVDTESLRAHLWVLCEQVSARCKAKGLAGRTITLKLKTNEFRTVTRSEKLPVATQLADTLFRTSEPLLKNVQSNESFRLIGVGVSSLEIHETDHSPSLLETEYSTRSSAERTYDELRQRYGNKALIKGRVFNHNK